MGYPPLEDLLPKAATSIYKLVRMASHRAMELADGRSKLIDIPSTTKLTTIALEEIKAGKVLLKEVADRFPSKKQEKAKADEVKEVAQEAGSAKS